MEDGGYEHYLVFLVKREESRTLMYFLCVFGREMCWEERKNAQKKGPNNSQKSIFSVLVQSGVPGAIFSPSHAFQGMAHLVGASAGPAAQQGALG